MAEEDLHSARSDIFEVVARADITSLKQILTTKEIDIEARDPAGRTALHLAIIAASVDVCQYLIEHGARLDAWTEQGETVVHLAAKRGQVDVLHAVMESLEAKQPAIQDDSISDGNKGTGGKKDRTVHVNCLTQKHQLSPLYIAVALGKLSNTLNSLSVAYT
jgi:ankyrin repeat protein